MNYTDFLASKSDSHSTTPISECNISNNPFPFQRDCISHTLKCGRGALFADTGLGKSLMSIEWAMNIQGKVLFVAPLAVAQQTIAEAKRFNGITIKYSKEGMVDSKYTITNYERLHHFDCSQFDGVVLDESSIIKGKSSKIKAELCESFANTPYKLACTATPAPNDYTEIGNHAEFLGIMSTQEMLTRWFVHDSANTADWRLKKHAVRSFWEWVSSWAACVSKPSDLGYDDGEYELPPLKIHTHTVDTETKTAYDQGFLFEIEETNATSLHKQKRETLDKRCDLVADMVNSRKDEPIIVWCESNDESARLANLIDDCVEVKGADSLDKKERHLLAFTNGDARVIVSKPSICGFGMNWQHCRRQVFASISYSYEKFYQAIRRSWRFGQKQPVDIDVVLSSGELPVWRTIERKANDHNQMKEHMKYAVFSKGEESKVKIDYNPIYKATLPNWLM